MKSENNYTKNDILDLVKERLLQNKNCFSEEEYVTITENIHMYSKIYILAIKDCSSLLAEN